MPQHFFNNDPLLIMLSHLRTPLWVLDVDTMQITWANNAGLGYWGVDDVTALSSVEIPALVTKTCMTSFNDTSLECHERDEVLSNLWTLNTNEITRTVEVSLSSILVDGIRKAVLCEVSIDLSDAAPETLHSIVALNHTPKMISLYDEKNRMVYSNPAARETQVESCNTLTARLTNDNDAYVIFEALENTDSCNVELEANTTDGSRWHAMNFQKVTHAITGEPSLLLSASDVTEKRHAQQVAYNLAYTDSLTGLPNRIAMKSYLDEILSSKDDNSTKFALFFLDLDRFKIINDSLGHAVGDQLLIEVAHRLKKSIGAHGMVCRLGGDEFVIIINGQTNVDRLREIAQNILHIMAEPVYLSEQNLRILPSIGICRFPDDGGSVPMLMANADAAMYLAKSSNSGFCFYDRKRTVKMAETVKDRLGLENDLVVAVECQQFELYYQPKMSCRTLTVTGVEALIRWNHPTRGMVSPDDFITIAEETGQILELGNWVLEAAMRQQRIWHNDGYLIPVSINISPRQFEDDDLARNISDTLRKTGCDPEMIELEITESMLLGDADQIHQTLQQLSAMGIKLALDDFGTGYSNLAYLQKYPLDILKIDRVFLADQKRSMLLGTILDMGKVLGLSMVAEGVENEAQADWLIANGCDQLQGFFYSRPIPVDAATRYLQVNGVARRNDMDRAA